LDQFFWLGAPASSHGEPNFDEEMKDIIEGKEENDDEKKSEHLDSLVINGKAAISPRLDPRQELPRVLGRFFSRLDG
jgi:hypothetical protein